MIWDCVLYNGERDVLDIRMGELSSLDVHHVLVEGDHTFQGDPKIVEPVSGSNLTHLIVEMQNIEDCSCGCADATRFSPGDAWVREAHQRNAVLPLIDVDPECLVLLGDVDEIPRSADIKDVDPPVRFLMDAYVFCLDWYGGRDVPGTVAIGRGQITTPAQVRHAHMRAMRGGWHFTYMGGRDEIERKLRSFSHAEMNVPDTIAALDGAIRLGRVPWNGVQLDPCEISHLPEYVQQNIEMFRHMLRPRG